MLPHRGDAGQGPRRPVPCRQGRGRAGRYRAGRAGTAQAGTVPLMSTGTDQGLRHVAAIRYVTPLREGGSLPGLVEADDDGLYVVKFRGAGQGLRALVAEVIVGRAGARARPARARTRDDRDRSGAWRGRARPRDPGPDHRQRRREPRRRLPAGRAPVLAGGPVAAGRPTRRRHRVARRAHDQRRPNTPRNPNLLIWHDRLWLIDHGAALYLQHGGLDPVAHAEQAVPADRRARAAARAPDRFTRRTSGSRPRSTLASLEARRRARAVRLART